MNRTERKIYVWVLVDDGLTDEEAQQQAVLRVHRAIEGRTDMCVDGQKRLERAIARERWQPKPKRGQA